VLELLGMSRRRGIPDAKLLGDIDPRALKPGGRIPWDSYAGFLERLETMTGGPTALEQLLCDGASASPMMQLFAGLVVSPRLLCWFGALRLAPRLYPPLGFRMDVLDDGRVRYAYVIPPECRGSLAYGHGSIGMMRAYPCLLGLPEARVDADLSSHRGVFHITLPPSRTLVARVGEALGPSLQGRARRRLASGEDGGLDLEGAAAAVFDTSAAAAEGVRLGQRLMRHRVSEELRDDVAAVLRERLLCEHVALWLLPPGGGDLTPVGPSGIPSGRPRSVRDLHVGEDLVGRLMVDSPGLTADIASPLFEALIPWIAMAVDQCRRGRPDDGPAGARIRERSARWGLTPREAQTLELLAKGLSNKEIATALSCTLRTAEVHVSHVLRKAGVDSRTALLARLWQA
jgi:DNA-binding CsgD family transcriptional regulator